VKCEIKRHQKASRGVDFRSLCEWHCRAEPGTLCNSYVYSKRAEQGEQDQIRSSASVGSRETEGWEA
jgi:hypothetical protein